VIFSMVFSLYFYFIFIFYFISPLCSFSPPHLTLVCLLRQRTCISTWASSTDLLSNMSYLSLKKKSRKKLSLIESENIAI
jgi:hypothetical protein